MSDVRIWPPAVLRERAARLAELRARAEAAEQEKNLSGKRLEHAQRDVINPLREAGRRNQFADMIRSSLLEGHERQR